MQKRFIQFIFFLSFFLLLFLAIPKESPFGAFYCGSGGCSAIPNSCWRGSTIDGDYCCWDQAGCLPPSYQTCTYNRRDPIDCDPFCWPREFDAPSYHWYDNCTHVCSPSSGVSCTNCNTDIYCGSVGECCDPACSDANGCGGQLNDSKCPNKCVGSVSYSSGDCQSNCSCSYSETDCYVSTCSSMYACQKWRRDCSLVSKACEGWYEDDDSCTSDTLCDYPCCSGGGCAGECSPGQEIACGNCGTKTCGSGCGYGSCNDKELSGNSCSTDSDCCSGYCKADYDGTGKWCANSNQCAHDGVIYASGAYPSSECYSPSERARCNAGNWEGNFCGADSNIDNCRYTDYSCSDSNNSCSSQTVTCGPGEATQSKTSCTSVTTSNRCRRSWDACDGGCQRRRNYYGCDNDGANCENTSRTSQDSNCGQGTRCSGGDCISSGTCDDSGWYCAASNCRRRIDYFRCDGSNNCDYTVGNNTVNCGQGERCFEGSCTATGRCGEGSWSCSGDCTRTKDVYRCDGSNSCTYDIGDDAETAPVGQWCSGGSFTSSGVCGYESTWSCVGECQRVRDEYRCDASQSCSQDVGDQYENAPSGQICEVASGLFMGGDCGNCGTCSGGTCTAEGCTPGFNSPDCLCPADGCSIEGDYYNYPDRGNCTGACGCDTGTGFGQPCEPISVFIHDSRCYDVPVVTTNDATNVEESTATLNGTLDDDGGEASRVRFQYGETDLYGTDTGWQPDFLTGNSFSQSISTLSQGTLYHFQAQAYNVAGTGSGLDMTFLTKPGPPFSFTAVPENSQVRLSWAKGDGAHNTAIRRKEGDFPIDISDGFQAYLGPSTSYIDTGLNNGTDYYYRAWSSSTAEGLTQYSDDYAQASTTPEQAPACQPHKVLGWAWSKNIGWISFSCGNCDTDYNGESNGGAGCPPAGTLIPDYGVDLRGQGAIAVFSGYAWSPNVGWITFNETDLSSPLCPDGTCQAWLDLGTNKISGWAKVLSDGSWISLRGQTTEVPPTTYGASWNQLTQEVEGWAWSDTAIGWISFNHLNCDSNDDGVSDGEGACPPAGTSITDYKVMIINNSPVAQIECHPDGCLQLAGACQEYTQSFFCLKNESSDPDLDIQNSEWAVYDINTGIKVYGTSTCFVNPLCNWTLPGIGSFASGGNYRAFLKVIDNGGLTDIISKDFVILQDIIAQAECSLDPGAGWQNCSGFRVSEREVIYFNDLSTPSDGTTIVSWTWTFEDGTPGSSSLQNPLTSFEKKKSNSGQVTLMVQDNDGRTNSISYQLSLTFPLPEWKEISPP